MKKYETKRNRELRRKRRRRSNAIAMLSALAVVFALGILIWNGKQSLLQKNQEAESRRELLQNRISEQETRSMSIEEYKKYVQTKKYIEQIAKEKFGLIYPDELLLKPSAEEE